MSYIDVLPEDVKRKIQTHVSMQVINSTRGIEKYVADNELYMVDSALFRLLDDISYALLSLCHYFLPFYDEYYNSLDGDCKYKLALKVWKSCRHVQNKQLLDALDLQTKQQRLYDIYVFSHIDNMFLLFEHYDKMFTFRCGTITHLDSISCSKYMETNMVHMQKCIVCGHRQEICQYFIYRYNGSTHSPFDKCDYNKYLIQSISKHKYLEMWNCRGKICLSCQKKYILSELNPPVIAHKLQKGRKSFYILLDEFSNPYCTRNEFIKKRQCFYACAAEAYIRTNKFGI